MNGWRKAAAAIAAASILTGMQPAMAAQGLSEDEISMAKVDANKLVPKKRVSFVYRSHSDAEVSGRAVSEDLEAEAFLLTPYCNVMSLQIEQGRTGHVDFPALEEAAQTYQLRLRFSCRALDREALSNAVITIRQGRFHEITPTAKRYTTIQRIKESGIDNTSRSRVGLVLNLPASEIAADMPIEVTIAYQNKSFLQFGNLYADGAFDQYDTKAPVFAWTPLHENL